MTLHIFNPEHDIALASGLANFTAPHAGRQLRHDLGFLPAIWAEEGDSILVDDVEQAERSWLKLRHRIATLMGTESLPGLNSQFTRTKLPVYSGQTLRVDPWGWNSALRAKLIRWGIDESQLPTLPQLDTIRQLSHRHTAAVLLPKLRAIGTPSSGTLAAQRTVGEMFECQTPEEVNHLLSLYGQLVMKAPWSSSGRGLRFLSVDRTPFAMQAGWFRNVVANQGCVMVEPYYNKVKDFGMEFFSDGRGAVSYVGLSLFQTSNGAYTGNILADEEEKQDMISRYIPVDLVRSIQEKICAFMGTLLKDRYAGAFGIDMMVIRRDDGDGFLLHPCVEINLRRTMGHVAISLTEHCSALPRLMKIEYNSNVYKIRISNL